MTSLPATVTAGPSNLPPNTCALPRTGQLAGLLTAIRDKQTARGDFIFYSDRIIRLLVEEGAHELLKHSFTVSPKPDSAAAVVSKLGGFSAHLICSCSIARRIEPPPCRGAEYVQ